MAKMNRRDFLAATVVLGAAGYAKNAWAVDYTAINPPASTADTDPTPFVPGSWTLAILPDPQFYSKTYPGLFHLQTRWIVENKDKYNITYVLTLGDLTHNNNDQQWQRASNALGRLEGVVPYTIVLGNHDYGPDGKAGNRHTLVNGYFPPSRFKNWPTFGGTMEKGRIENNYHLFKAAGRDWLILNLEMGPRNKALAWAGKILAKYPDHKAIIATHAYLYSDSTRYDWHKKGENQEWSPYSYIMAAEGTNDGEEMWQKLVKKHANVSMTINGHVLNDGVGFLASKADNDNWVHQMLINFQEGVRPIGGESWLRLLEFGPDGRTVQVKAYCPLYEKYRTDPDHHFTFNI